jgi:hypothetical protein
MSEKDKALTTVEANPIDGFFGYSDDVAGMHDNAMPVGIIKGTLVKFSSDFKYVDRNGAEMPAGLELVAIDVLRIVQKWRDGKPVETIILDPGQAWPDIERLNAECKSEWVEKFGIIEGLLRRLADEALNRSRQRKGPAVLPRGRRGSCCCYFSSW